MGPWQWQLLVFLAVLTISRGTAAEEELKIHSVSGCKDSDPLKTTSACPVRGGVTITIEGEGFSLMQAEVLVRDQPCTGVVHRVPNKLLCTLPKGELGLEADVTVKRGAGRTTCSDGWSQYQYACYKRIDQASDWNSAERVCNKDHQGVMASITNAESGEFFQSLAKDVKTLMWIGAHDQVTKGTWQWTDGSAFEYTNWAVGEPNNAGQNERCLSMMVPTGQWNDANCFLRLPFVCKQKLSPHQPGSVTISKAVRYRTPFVLPSFDTFEELGVGGLDSQFEEIFRRAFASRTYDPSIIEKLGIRHVKGVMIYGPPGTGKTLLARKMAEILQAKNVQVVNGPEIMSKYVGQSESNIRNLFSESEQEWKTLGSDAGLHVVIFDEMDAIMRVRGSNSDDSAARAVYDGVTNSLLAIMDGVYTNDNLLVVGLTNRLELIDPALRRPGRFEVTIKMPLPDFEGRKSIFRIHTKSLRDNGYLDDNVDFDAIAVATNSYTGADIEGVVKSALSFGLSRATQADPPQDLKVLHEDFEKALEEVPPTLGNKHQLKRRFEAGMVEYNEQFSGIMQQLKDVIDMMEKSEQMNHMRVVLHGHPGSGTTALASYVAHHSMWPYTQIIHADELLPLSDLERNRRIMTAFEDCHRVKKGIIVLDRIEALLEYVAVGSKLNGLLLNTLAVMLNQVPPKESQMLVIMTTSTLEFVNALPIQNSYDLAIKLPLLDRLDAKIVLREAKVFNTVSDLDIAISVLPPRVSIKKLLFVVKLTQARAHQKGRSVDSEIFAEILQQVGIFNATQIARFSMDGAVL